MYKNIFFVILFLIICTGCRSIDDQKRSIRMNDSGKYQIDEKLSVKNGTLNIDQTNVIIMNRIAAEQKKWNAENLSDQEQKKRRLSVLNSGYKEQTSAKKENRPMNPDFPVAYQ